MSEAHLRLLAEMIDLLESYARSVSRESIETDREVWLKVRGALEVAAQCCIDLALVILAVRGLGPPESYRDAFATLARAKLIEPELASQLEGWAGLRNVLAHLYTRLNLEKLHGALSQTAPLRAFHAIAARELRSEP
ncbi:MAG: DUF86 domain-containing protein [Myxococcales bacterium]|nr:DUF86 domain-containing protein [Myxococcales bacterium]